MSGGEPTLGEVPAHLEERESEIAAQAEPNRGRIAELTARLEEFDQGTEEARITRKTCSRCPVRRRGLLRSSGQIRPHRCAVAGLWLR
jgi:hypothetical protein